MIIKKNVFRSDRETVIKVCNLIREVEIFNNQNDSLETVIEFTKTRIVLYNSISFDLDKIIDNQEFFITPELLLSIDFRKIGENLEGYRKYCTSCRAELEEVLPIPHYIREKEVKKK